MLKIDLNFGDARVTNDEWCYIVHLRKIKNKGKNIGEEYWLASTYHNTLTQVANKLAQLAGEGLNIADSVIFEKIEKLLEGEAHRLEKKLNKGAK